MHNNFQPFSESPNPPALHCLKILFCHTFLLIISPCLYQCSSKPTLQTPQYG